MIAAVCRYVFPILVLFVFSHPVNAQSNFAVSEEATYKFSENGAARVTRHISLSNLSSDNYPSQYILALPKDSFDISAYDKNGKLQLILKDGQDAKTVSIILLQEDVGIQEQTIFSLVYTSYSYVERSEGNVSIYIPAISSKEALVNYKLSVYYPPSWGSIIESSPASKTPLVWTDNEVGQEPIRIIIALSSTEAKDSVEKNASEHALLMVSGVITGIIGFLMLFVILGQQSWKKENQ